MERAGSHGQSITYIQLACHGNGIGDAIQFKTGTVIGIGTIPGDILAVFRQTKGACRTEGNSVCDLTQIGIVAVEEDKTIARHGVD